MNWWDNPVILFAAAWVLFMAIAMPLAFTIGPWAVLPAGAAVPLVLGFASWRSHQSVE
jgi:hypothetical protein